MDVMENGKINGGKIMYTETENGNAELLYCESNIAVTEGFELSSGRALWQTNSDLATGYGNINGIEISLEDAVKLNIINSELQ
mgnify:CR=1 FL=1